VAGNKATVKLNIAHAPGASFTLEVLSKVVGSSVYKTSGVVTTADYDFISAVKLPGAGTFTVKVTVTDIYGNAATAESVLESAGESKRYNKRVHNNNRLCDSHGNGCFMRNKKEDHRNGK